MNRTIKVIKRGFTSVLSLVMTVSICLSLIQVPVSAANTAKERQSAMIEYFQNQGAEALSNDITEADLRLFGIFLSNFYIPYETNIYDAAMFQTIVRDACAYCMGYDDYMDMSATNKELVDVFYSKMLNSISSVINTQSGALKIKNADGTIGVTATIGNFLRKYDEETTFFLCDSQGNDFWSYYYNAMGTPLSKKKNNYCSLSMYAAFCATATETAKEYLKANIQASDGGNNLFITPFGDIIDSTGVVIIPGCINPYTFDVNGDCLPLNNSFFMGSLASINSTKVAELTTKNNDTYAYFLKERLTKNVTDTTMPFLISGVYTAAPTDFFDIVGGKGFFSLPTGDVKDVTKDTFTVGEYELKNVWIADINTLATEDYAGLNTLQIAADLDSKSKQALTQLVDNQVDALLLYNYFTRTTSTNCFTLQVTPDKNITSKLETVEDGNADANFFAKLFGFDDVHLRGLEDAMSASVMIPESNLDKVKQDLYVQLSNSAYGSYNYTDATHAYIFQEAHATEKNANTVESNSYSLTNKTYTFLDVKSFTDVSVGDYTVTFYDNVNLANFQMEVPSFGGLAAYTQNCSLVETFYRLCNANAETYTCSFAQLQDTNDTEANALRSLMARIYEEVYDLEKDTSDLEIVFGLKGDPANFFGVLRMYYNRQMFRYENVFAAANLGYILNLNAESVGYASIARETNFWAEIFYAYMMSYTELNPNLPAVLLEDLNTLFANALGSQNLKGEALAEENQKLARKLMEQSLDLMSSGYSKAKEDFVNGFLDSFVLSQHRKMLGLTSTDIGKVDTKVKQYTGYTSPVTTPSLSELPLTSTILENYRVIYIVAIILAVVAAVIMVAVNMRTLKQAVATVVLIAFCLLIPQTFIDSITTLTNTTVTSMFSDRFLYWAIIQHQQAIQQVSVAESTNNTNEVVLTQALIDVTSYYDKSTGVQLKWMAAKKTQTFTELTETDLSQDTTIPGLNTYKWLFSGYLKQESYANEPMATYVYRTYTSLAESAQLNYEALKGKTDAVGTVQSISMQPVVIPMADYGVRTQNTFYRTVPLSNDKVTEALNRQEVDLSTATGLSIETLESDDTLAGYLLYTESPFYYFYNVLKSSTMPTENDENEFLTNFLSEEMYKSKKDNATNGAYIDFLDFEGLFSNVIPYLEASNKYVTAWTDKYGLEGEVAKTYIGSSVNIDHVLNKVWNMYSPWVDTLSSSKSATANIEVMQETVTIEDAFNAASYAQYRPMVFSEAQRIAQGVSESALTDVEQRLLRVQAKTYEDLRYLANYAAFDDEAIVTVAAMVATFNFNKEFSDTAIMGEASELYPQGFELKCFNFDAFLRLIMLNSTGTSVMSTADIYETIILTEAFPVGLSLLVVDILNLYVVSTCMTLFLIALFTLSVVYIVVMIIQTPEEVLKLSWSTLILPALLYMFVTLLYAGGIALLMGEGLTNIVGARGTAFVTNSPGTTLIIMIILAIFVVYCYIRILIKLVKGVVVYGKNAGRALAATFKEVIQRVKDTAMSHGHGSSVELHGHTDSVNSYASANKRRFADGLHTAKNAVMGAGAHVAQNAQEMLDNDYAANRNVVNNEVETNANAYVDSVENTTDPAERVRATRIADEINRLAVDSSTLLNLQASITNDRDTKLSDIKTRKTAVKAQRKLAVESEATTLKEIETWKEKKAELEKQGRNTSFVDSKIEQLNSNVVQSRKTVASADTELRALEEEKRQALDTYAEDWEAAQDKYDQLSDELKEIEAKRVQKTAQASNTNTTQQENTRTAEDTTNTKSKRFGKRAAKVQQTTAATQPVEDETDEVVEQVEPIEPQT